jgi:DNA-binding IscR family transcriptional regulator
MSTAQDREKAAKRTVSKSVELGRKYVETTDKVARELDIPLVATVLTIQDKVFGYADDLGIGEEVRSITYGLRSAGYVSAVVGPSASAAAVGAVASLGAVGCIGAVGAVVAIFSVFGGGPSDEEIQTKQRKAATKAQIRYEHLLKRLSFAELAAEQDERAGAYDKAASLLIPLAKMAKGKVKADMWTQIGSDQKKAELAKKLSLFYRGLPPRLSELEEELFLSNTNLGRWTGAQSTFAAKSLKERVQLRLLFQGKSDVDAIRTTDVRAVAEQEGRNTKGSFADVFKRLVENETARLNKAASLLPPGYRPPQAPGMGPKIVLGLPKTGPRIHLELPPGSVPARGKGPAVAKVAIPVAAAAAGFFVFGPIGAAVALIAGIGLSRS